MQKPSHNHEHEFRLDDGASIDFDGRYVTVGLQCIHRPILDSVTDEARCETYYEEGPRCEAGQTTRIGVADPVGIDSDVVVTYDANYDLWNDIMDELADDLKEAAVDIVDGDTATATVETNGRDPENYRVGLTYEDREVNE